MTDPLTIPASSGLVQVIQISWDKSARGGQGARKRSSVPLVFEVEDGHLRDVRGQLQAQVLRWGMGNDFSEPLESRYERVPLEDGYGFGCVTVSGKRFQRIREGGGRNSATEPLGHLITSG